MKLPSKWENSENWAQTKQFQHSKVEHRGTTLKEVQERAYRKVPGKTQALL